MGLYPGREKKQVLRETSTSLEAMPTSGRKGRKEIQVEILQGVSIGYIMIFLKLKKKLSVYICALFLF